ncbi:MAG: hypothetical protein EXR68_07500 [Dehalococcoidia bacterium]|nr:hypothetical protein [Dehalococcoidia bacterium]
MFIVERWTLLSFSSGSYTATLQIAGSRSSSVVAVPVSRGVASSEMVTGRCVAVAIFDAGNPVDAMVVGVY